MNKTLLFCGTKNFFNEPKIIYHELIRTFSRHAEFVNKKTIASEV